jgi:16S rRNA (cytosine967-C5)-methyltransferase
MLREASGLVPPGGGVVYSTCTLEPEENEEQVEAFLAENPRFAVEETGRVDALYLDSEGRLMVLPQETDFDGAFAARLVRRA